MRLFVTATPHGFGHAVLLAAVVDALRARTDGLRLTVMTTLPPAWLGDRFGPIDTLIAEEPDFGMAMAGPTVVDVPASLARYHELAERRDAHVAHQADLIAAADADVVLTSISPLSLAAAAASGRPGVGMAPFTWVEILAHYGAGQGIERVLQMLRADYATARLILAPEPAMPIGTFAQVRPIGPVCHRPRPLPTSAQAMVGRDANIRIGLVGFGGVEGSLSVARWPYLPGWHWIVGRAETGERPDMTRLEALDAGFSDLLPSADLVVAKPGYGTFVEAAVAGVPVLSGQRPDWPESAGISAWTARYVRFAEMPWDDLVAGHGLGAAVGRLIDQEPPPGPGPAATGADDAARIILDLADRSGQPRR